MKHSWVRVWREHNVGRRSVCHRCLLIRTEKKRLLGWHSNYSGGYTAFTSVPECVTPHIHNAHRWLRSPYPWEMCALCDATAMFVSYSKNEQQLWMRSDSTLAWVREYVPCV